ncbi:sulfate adenylyltransferase subunit 1 [Paenalcaligenes sp. Me131]|uniref:sulfate adenylyltransferase subunit 1 n=1 Tax=Paenalcaligenes sp. Me131 TaxID=3392636 RepID=UPI003D275948
MNTVNESWVNANTTDVLRFITAGSVDDGKSTLIGRLLLDTRGVFADQLTAINKSKYRRTTASEPDLALLTDGLEAEREQGITIDIAYRYFATPKRKFIVADAPGHEQYTRNMITGASTAQAAIILIDASKARDGQLLTQTRRHSTIAHLLNIPHIIVAINKMDLVDWDENIFNTIKASYAKLAAQVGIKSFHAIPVSALQGDNISQRSEHTPWFTDLPLLQRLEQLPTEAPAPQSEARLFVQWVIRHDGHSAQAFRGYAGQLQRGTLSIGDSVRVWPSQTTARITSLLRSGQAVNSVQAGDAVTLTLDKELDISRGDLLSLATEALPLSRTLEADLCWLDTTALNPARHYLLKQGTRLTQAKLTAIHHVRDIETLEPISGSQSLHMNDLAAISLTVRDPLVNEAYQTQPATGAFILIDPATHQTAAAGMLR